jgi:hypothetical protein
MEPKEDPSSKGIAVFKGNTKHYDSPLLMQQEENKQAESPTTDSF